MELHRCLKMEDGGQMVAERWNWRGTWRPITDAKEERSTRQDSRLTPEAVVAFKLLYPSPAPWKAQVQDLF